MTDLAKPGSGRMPRQIPYIIANEGCERFSFYGMRNILTPFLISTLLLFVPLYGVLLNAILRVLAGRDNTAQA